MDITNPSVARARGKEHPDGEAESLFFFLDLSRNGFLIRQMLLDSIRGTLCS